MKKKLLIFSITYEPYIGGAELAIKEETDRIETIEFDMITLRFDSRLPSFEKVGNVNVYRIGFTKNNAEMKDLVKFPLKINKFIYPFIALIKARNLHKKKKYDGIWVIMAAYAGFAGMFFKTFYPKIPYLLTIQEGDPVEYILNKVKYIRPFFNKIFTKADQVQVISEHLAQFAKSMNFKKDLSIIPNAVDVAHFSKEYSEDELLKLREEFKKEEGDIFVVTTSRLVLKNAVDDVIKSFEYLPKNYKFLIVGTGPDFDKLEDLSKSLNLKNRVYFLGQINHRAIPKYLKISDIFIRPSLSEGLGNSFIEAMAAGIPVIATQVGGIVDFLFDPEKNPEKKPTGLFCEIRNPKDIARQIIKISENKKLREEIVSNAENLVSVKYDWNTIVKDMRTVFNKLLENKC